MLEYHCQLYITATRYTEPSFPGDSASSLPTIVAYIYIVKQEDGS